MGEIPTRVVEIDTSRPVVCICHHGVRSMHVARFLADHGIDPIFNLAGGIDAWAREVNPDCPTY
jgi:rhodanese-related sulfurtransferase